LEFMNETDDEETQRGLRPWLPPSTGAGRGCGLLSASQWSSDITVVGRTTLVDTVPTGYGRPAGVAGTCSVDETMTGRPAAPWPGSVDAIQPSTERGDVTVGGLHLY